MIWYCSLRRACALGIATVLIAACGGQPQTSAPTSAPTTAAASPPPAATQAAPTKPPAPTSQPLPTAPAAPAATAPAAPAPALTRSLQLQEPFLQGEDVTAAQQRLHDLGYTRVGAADGVFGPDTDAAVRAFQNVNGLTSDGIVGPQTWEALFGAAAIPAPTVTPIVAGDSGWVMGGVYAGGWLDGATTAQLLNGNERYRLYAMTSALGDVTGGKPESLGPEACEQTFQVALTPAPTASQTIAVGGDWEVLPRVPVEETATPALEKALAKLLQEQGISRPEVQISKIVRIDIEGDGTDEQLIVAARHVGGDTPTPMIAAGDYSLVALSRGANEALIPIVAEYYPQAAEFAAPNLHSLVAVLDLNGDGQLEMIVDSAYYEGAATIAYNISGDQVQETLVVGCGV